MVPVGRLAPSPTGSLHVGNVRTFLWAWLSIRSRGGRLLMRVEDLDTPRVKPGTVETMLDELRWLGFDWDGEPVVQSARRDFYRRIHGRLAAALYPCRCTRAEIAAAQSAPHEGEAEVRYPGTCRATTGPARTWRLRVEPGPVAFTDLLSGPHAIDVAASVGDFAVARSPEDPAYQLAVAADDIDAGVTEVVRGDDLIPSTARQILIYRALGAPVPAWGHTPLVVGPDGKRLAKRHGDARIVSLRRQGARPDRIIGRLAEWSGLGGGDATPAALLPRWSWDRASRDRVVLTPDRIAGLI